MLRPRYVVYFITNRCNSKCKTCNIWKNQRMDIFSKELSYDEWIKVFHSIGPVRWITFTGGEPFLHDSFSSLVLNAIKIQRPRYINIATNGLLSERIFYEMETILKESSKINFFINISLEALREKNDFIRGVDGHFDSVLMTLKKLSILKVKYSNLRIAINTVVSKFNINHILEFKFKLKNLLSKKKIFLDNHIFEPAQEKKELFFNNFSHSLNSSNFLLPHIYKRKLIHVFTLLSISSFLNIFTFKDVLRSALRLQYYLRLIIYYTFGYIKRCSAARSFIEISPFGDVWTCGVLALSLGNLRKNNFDFYKIYNSNFADTVRERLKKCRCTMLCTHYL